jgi:hypothetical protein
MNLLPRDLPSLTLESIAQQAILPATVAPISDGKRLFVALPNRGILAFDTITGVDMTPPTVKMLLPYPGDEFSTQPGAQLLFYLDDLGSGVKPSSIRVLADHILLKHSYSPNGILTVPFGPPTGNRPLRDGTQLIKVAVEDWKGNLSETPFYIKVVNQLKQSQPKTSEES